MVKDEEREVGGSMSVAAALVNIDHHLAALALAKAGGRELLRIDDVADILLDMRNHISEVSVGSS